MFWKRKLRPRHKKAEYLVEDTESLVLFFSEEGRLVGKVSKSSGLWHAELEILITGVAFHQGKWITKDAAVNRMRQVLDRHL